MSSQRLRQPARGVHVLWCAHGVHVCACRVHMVCTRCARDVHGAAPDGILELNGQVDPCLHPWPEAISNRTTIPLDVTVIPSFHIDTTFLAEGGLAITVDSGNPGDANVTVFHSSRGS